ncbi:M23 family metallopeptidase [Parvularcula sp. ZS-1/3]|uniref:M23 family metallopeptidase n=1 Tax=Parvularcula mediterranea TaxID=2732508 RepID=A0A7Y3W443_9PROT|nr:M23 family metallopeptidase [Parvularcula mediterranea]NNU14811.1 M23 family metallopeptidase [Parvularcula mediterranea]
MLRTGLIIAWLFGALLPAAAQDDAPRPLWSGSQTLSDDSLFEAFRSYRDKTRFISEPIIEGEALPDFLKRMGVMDSDAEAASKVFFEAAELERLPEGTTVRVKFMNGPATVYQVAGGRYPRALLAMEVFLGTDRQIVVGRTADGFEAQSRPVELETRYAAAAGEINRSLFSAAFGADVPREVMLRFADVFAFDVDFAREIFRGDRFEVVYEILLDSAGNEVGYGDIVFAALTWRGGIEAKGYYRYKPEGAEEASYYDATGRDPRTLLMKTPINGARVTSRFGRRRHPVLGFVKGHAGIDFGAPRGTPVLAAGDGVVKLAGPRGTFGNYVRLEHSGGIETAYAHLDRFAPGLKEGDKVRQGEVIAYVGSTGRSTGPHLHYEVLRDGEQQNPETVKVAVGETLTGEGKARFEGRREGADSLRITPFAVAEARLP